MMKFIAAILVIALAGAGFEAFRFLSSGPGKAEEQLVFEVPTGVPFRRVAQDLQDKGLISDAFKLRVLAKATGQGGRLKHGEYALNKGMTPQEILGLLVSGKSIQYPITFPEGSNVYDMAAVLNSKGIFKGEEFLKAVKDKKIIQELLGVEVSSLEGYLFPETYNVTRYTPLKDLLAQMVGNFKTAYSHVEAQLKSRGQSPPLSRHELVTLASIVEKETGAAEERPMIASVFYNRLRKNMKLQSDPTIIYGIWVDTGSYKQNISKEDITRATRYNTYTVPRLPWGPIANPGREALAAVMMPANSEYLYFVSRNNGTHVFTRSYDEHLKAVKSFQLDPAAREGKSWRDLNKTPASTTSN
ncbi:MAG: endolytic transglycosylase MltG [Bdellovibrionales bacterium]|nr:endolytic transglycosylase MltG [Bdellovibrionales bacterium]